MIRDLFEKQRPLMIAGCVSLILGFVTLLLSLVDPTEILGINRWIKPMKFFFSIAVFVWTIAVLLDQLKGEERFGKVISWTMILVFVGEMLGIAGQPLRGTTSHFNIGTPFDGAVYAFMGVLIVINSLLVAAITYKYFVAKVGVSTTVLWAIRLGLVIFLAGSIQGGYMAAQIGHTVGAADGGPGLPLTNWSTTAGDLRVAHFLGLHAIQVVPLLGVLLERWAVPYRIPIVFVTALFYFGFFVAVLVQALNGRPLIAI